MIRAQNLARRIPHTIFLLRLDCVDSRKNLIDFYKEIIVSHYTPILLEDTLYMWGMVWGKEKRVVTKMATTLDFAGGADRARTGDLRRDRPAF